MDPLGSIYRDQPFEGSLEHSGSPTTPLLGGDIRDRTVDLLNANQTLSQLSYVPKLKVGFVLVKETPLESSYLSERHSLSSTLTPI